MTAAGTAMNPDSQAAMTDDSETLTGQITRLAGRLDEEVGLFCDVIGVIEKRVDGLIGIQPVPGQPTGQPEPSQGSPLFSLINGLNRLATQRQRLQFYADRL